MTKRSHRPRPRDDDDDVPTNDDVGDGPKKSLVEMDSEGGGGTATKEDEASEGKAEAGGGGGGPDESEEEEGEESSARSPKPRIDAAREDVNRFVDSTANIAFMSLVTTYALYGDDVRILGFDPGADGAFLALTTMAFALFLSEIALLCWCRDDYLVTPDLPALRELLSRDRWRCRKSSWSWLGRVGKAAKAGSFYFWLDLVSTFSMAIEMPWLLRADGDVANEIDGTIAGKASVAGARAANKLKVIRMVRLVRLAKLYKYFSARQRAAAAGEGEPGGEKGVESSHPPESHVGAEMSDRTTKKVIVGILIMLLGIPLLQADEVDYFNEFSMKMAFEQRKLMADGIDPGELERWEFSEDLLVRETDCIDIAYNGFEDGLPNDAIIPPDRARIQDLRVEELDVFTIGDDDYVRSMTAVFDASGRVREEALLGILLTSFVIVLLGLGMVSFTKDVRNLVIVPIEHMIQLVREISENPLGNNLSLKIDDKHRKDDGMETTLLIRTISKIAGLMRVGFGEAGADIIGKNLNVAHGTADAMNLLGNGRKIHSIFGFCDVRQFTDTTECLQEEVMLFVNRIAHVLHSIVVQCDGAANKNIGDAFLLTWKVGKDKLASGDPEDHDYAADKALYSFVKTMIEMVRHEDFLCKFSPRALSALYERMPGYKCRIGCGLHFGWAIEGAIGSSKKIDASYISPHVNMSEALEGATKGYGVPLLMSEPFRDLLSQEARAGCRRVDAVRKRGGGGAMGLYTYDVDLSTRFSRIPKKQPTKKRLPHHRTTTFSLVTTQRGPSARLLDASNRGTDASSSGVLGDLPDIEINKDFPYVWMSDADVVRARSRFGENQRRTWHLGMEAFEEGRWDVAKDRFDEVLAESDGKDGPSLYLLKRMGEHDFRAPDSWQGYWED
ncbi:hypothetical protein ACHAWF_015882 [Thalassiosira exigua]